MAAKLGSPLAKILFLGLSAAIGVVVYNMVIQAGGAFRWDEAAHALRGLLMAQHLQHRDWFSLLYDTYRQVYWPPLHSWVTGVWFLVAGASVESARAVSVAAFVGAAIVLYAAAMQMDKAWGDLIGWIAGALFLTTAALAIYAGQAMLEIPGLLAVALTIWAYFWLASNPEQPWGYVLLGLTIAGAYFVKSNYGILLLAAVVLAELFVTRLQPRLLLRTKYLSFALTLLVVFGIWFLYPAKLTATWRAMVNIPWGPVDAYSAQGLLFYPSAIYHIAGSVWMVGLFVVAFIAAFRYWQDRNVRFLLILIVLQLVVAQVHHTKLDRHIFPMMPALYLCIAFVFTQALKDRQSNRQTRVLAWLLGGLLVIGLVVSVRDFGSALRSLRIPRTSALAGYIATATAKLGDTLIVGTLDLTNPSPPVLDWQLIAEQGKLNVYQSGVATDYTEDRRTEERLTDLALPLGIGDAVSARLARYLRDGALRTFYIGLSVFDREPLRQPQLNKVMQEVTLDGGRETVMLLTAPTEEAKYPRQPIDVALRKLGYELVKTDTIGKNSIRIDTYANP